MFTFGFTTLVAIVPIVLGRLASESSCTINANGEQTCTTGYSSATSKGGWGGDDYNEDEALETLMLAYAAYSTKDNLEKWGCGCCTKTDILSKFAIHYVHEQYGNQAYCGHYLTSSGIRKIVLTFRGTQNPCGWVCNDFDADMVPYPGVKNGMVYEGFWRVWQNVKDGNDTSYYGYKDIFVPKIIEMLDQLCLSKDNNNNNKCELIITGHSLGASLAQVASLTFADLLKESGDKYNCNIKVYNYGSPRWANIPLSNYYDGHDNIIERWRLVNGYDIVPMLPPVIMKYWHGTRQVWYEHGLGEPHVGSNINGELQTDGYGLKDCLTHTQSCFMDHTTYLNYYYDSGECTVVTKENYNTFYTQEITSYQSQPQSKIGVLPNPVCEFLCKR